MNVREKFTTEIEMISESEFAIKNVIIVESIAMNILPYKLKVIP